jgi:hypothetical protein
LIRKICKVGTGSAVFLPASWLRFIEKKYGRPIREVAIEVDKVLKIRAIINENDRVEK